MLKKHSWLLAFVVLAGCGAGEPAPESTTAAPAPTRADTAPPASQEAAAAQSPAPAPAAAAAANNTAPPPTTGRFQLGTHYTRLSPTQPTSSSPDQVEVAEVFWYG